MEKNIVEEIRKFVEEECKKPSSKYGYEPFTHHFIKVHSIAVQLAKKLNAELEIVEIAAWLHDIGSIIFGRENHHITGAQIAEKKLKELNFPEDKIEKVKLCILNHRGSKEDENSREFLESKIIAEADAISSFEFIEGLFRAAYTEKLSQDEARKSVRQKLQNKWNQLSLEESKKLIKPKYEAAMLLLGEENENRN